MALSSTTNRVREQGDGVTDAFDTTFPVQEASHLQVYKVVRATDVETLQTITTDYTVSISTVTKIATVTFVVAPLSTEDSLIVRTVPLTQGADIPTNNIFREVQIENALDKQMMAIQQLDEKIGRSVKLPIASSVTGITLPAPEDGKTLVWDGTDGTMRNSETDIDDLATAVTAAETAQGLAETAKTAAELAETNAEAAQAAAEAAAATLTLASQAEAEAASDNTKYMSALRVKQQTALVANLPVKDEDNMVSDSASHVPTQQSVKAYVDATAGGFTDRGDPSGYDKTEAGLTIDDAWHDWDLSAILPAGAKAAVIHIFAKNTAAAKGLKFRKNGNSNDVVVTELYTQVNDLYVGNHFIVAVDTNRVLEYYVQNSGTWTIRIAVAGYFK